MQIDKDDRYVSETSHKALTPSKGSSIFRQLLKPRALILILVVALLMLIFIMSLSLNKEDDSWVVPPSKLDKIQSTSATNNNIAKNIDLTLPPMTSEKSKVSSVTESSSESQTKAPVETSTKMTTETTSKTATDTSDKTSDKTSVKTSVSPPVEKEMETTVVPSVEDKKQQGKIAEATSVKPVTTENNSAPEQKMATGGNMRQPSATTANKDGKTIIANNHFSIQLVGSTSFENVKRLMTEYNLKNAHIYETRRNDKPWYVLIQGDYLTLESAREAIKSLPDEFQKNKAWAKAGTVINKEMAMSPTQPN